MVEVFVMGVLVSVVKLSHLAHIYAGIALWSYGILILLFAGAMSMLNPQALWAEIKPNE
jgi:paraquat-inducible protein A